MNGVKRDRSKAVNVASKSRDRKRPYASWDNGMGGRYLLLKSWQVDNGDPLARWMVYATAPFAEMGDMYVRDMRSVLLADPGLEFDTSIWPTREDFVTWARGSRG